MAAPRFGFVSSRLGRALALFVVAALVVTTGGDAVVGTSGSGAAAHQPRPLPGQRWGSAAGQAHLVGGKVNKTLPATQRSRYPKVTVPAGPANTASATTGPTARRTGYDRATSRELTDARGAYERVYANADGTETTEFSATPMNYKSGNAWTPIDTTLSTVDGGGWRDSANSAELTFAPRADAPQLAGLRIDDHHAMTYGLAGASPAAGTAKASTVTYPAALPHVDLQLTARPGGMKETLVLQGKDAPAVLVFPLHLTGLTASVAGNQVVLADATGATRAVIPPGSMVDAAGALSTGVRYRLVAGPALEVTLDAAWLHAPARAYPIQVDPTVALPVEADAADSSMYVHGSSSASGSSELQVGTVDGASTASYLKFASLVTKLSNHTIYGAALQVVNYDAETCQARPVTVHPVTAAWSPTGSYAYPGPAVGAALASKSFSHGYFAQGQATSACPTAAELLDLGDAGAQLVQGWVTGATANNGLSLRASVSDPASGKRFTGSGTANPPKLFVTHSPYNATYAIPNPVPSPPVLQNQDGHVKVTVTNLGAETWTPSTYYLAYRAYNAVTSAPVGQLRAANLTSNVARGARVTLDATIKALPPGSYFLDFTMVRTGGVVFTDHQVPPARIVLRVVDIAPVVQELYPPNGYQAPTLTPQLWGRALDVDAPPGASLSYKFEVCERDSAGNPTGCSDSGYQTRTAWTVPAGKLSWTKAYLWRVYVKDSGNEVISPWSTVLAQVPQPELTSRIAGAAQADQDQQFDAQSGNFSAVAVDASVATVGPELTLVRTYNSLDPRRDGAFGAGWSTRYDMRLVPDGDGSGNVVVTYPDGQAVRFGRNPDGSYATSAGRSAALTLEAGGSWKLVDRAGTVYLFSAAGKLQKTTDSAQRSVLLTYGATDGKLAKAQVSNSQTNTAGRALRFTWSGAHVGTVTNDLGTTWTYTYNGDVLSQVCATGGVCTGYASAAGSHYRSAVLDSRPESYWRLGEPDGADAGSEVAVNLGKDSGKYAGVTLGTPGALAGITSTAATFNGTSSRVDLPKGALKKSYDGAVELWFKANPTGTGGPLLGYQDKAFGTTPGRGVPVLYVGTDGKLRGQFGATTIAPITSPGTVNDGRWHHVVLSAMGTTQTLYLDGVQAGQANAMTVDHSLLTFNQLGAASVSTPGSWPAWGSAGQRFFTGAIDEVALYSHPIGPASAAAHFRYGSTAADQLVTVTLPSGAVAAHATYDTALDRVATYTDSDGGTWKIGAPTVYGGDADLRRSVQVLDPANRAVLTEYDALTGQLLRSGRPLGLELRDEDRPGDPVPPPPPPVEECTAPDPADPAFCTVIPSDSGGPVFVQHPLDGMAIRTYQYDDAGNLSTVTNENGDSATMTYDARGNVVSTKTCRSSTQCNTSYTTYPATVSNPFDPRGELPTETRDARSASATDPTYRTAYTYTATGDISTQTNPDGSVIRHTYSTGAEGAAGGGAVPPGLVLTTTDARGKVTRYGYYANGDLAQTTEPSGLLTKYTYDALGRELTETEVSDTFPAGITTTTAYDAMSRPTSVTEPATTDAVTGTRHQHQTVTTYDVDGNPTKVEEIDKLGGDPTRTTTMVYDEHGRAIRTTDPEGNETTSSYDRFGNETSTVDENGTRYDFAYTARNMLAEVRLRAYTGDTAGGLTGDYLVLHSYSYDFAGRLASDTDAMGRRTEYTYYGDDLPHRAVLKDFHNPDGSVRDYVLEDDTYDAAGNRTKQVTGNGTSTLAQTFDRMGNVTTATEDPAGLARTTTYVYDANGNVTRTSLSGHASNVPWAMPTTPEVVDYAYDDSGNQIRETVSAGTTTQVTTSAYDQRGLLVATTDPRGNVSGADPAAYTTTYTNDELERPITETGPPVLAETGGQAPTTVRPTVKSGYNTFDDQVAVLDEVGAVRRWSYDRLGRVVSASEPAYRAPGAPDSVVPTTLTKYDGLGNPVEVTDPRGSTTRMRYDQLGRMISVDNPTSTADVRAVSTYTYTRTGQLLTSTDPMGGRVEATYDDLDRRLTSTQVERKPVLDNFTTRYSYDDAGRPTAVSSPTGATTVVAYDTLGQRIRSTDPNGVTTQFGFDQAGRDVRTSDPLGRTTRIDYDSTGAAISQADLAPNGSTLRTEHFAYDPAGNPASATDALGVRTTFTYDADNRLVRQVEPVSASASITTSFGYDGAGRRTRYTNGLGNSTLYTYNSLGLTESVVEPPTAAYPNAADRTWVTSYDAAGDPVRLSEPGGITRDTTYDAAGRPITETGTGASATTETRTRGYDLLDRVTQVSAPGGSDTFGYDDRGNLLTARGPSGAADFGYDADGNMTTRTDAAGTARFGYLRGRLATVQDGITGVAEQYGYDTTGRLATIGYGDGHTRTYGYDDLGQTSSDTLRNGNGQTVASIAYSYDAASRLTGKTTAGTAGAGVNTYAYDQAGRLTSWTSPTATTAYEWDAAGNRTKAGSKTATYDARNELLSDGSATYTYTARGTLASRTRSGATDSFTFDAFDRMTAAAGQTYAYDGLDRLVSRGGTSFGYAGLSDELVAEGARHYARGPDDAVLATGAGAATDIVMTDEHGDVIGGFDPADPTAATLTGSTAYDPFGTVTAAQGDDGGDLGFQGDWTDPSTGLVDMGARWYDPGTGAFESRDSTDYTGGDSVLANRFTYGAADPLDYADPDGHWPCALNPKCVAKKVGNGIKTVVNYGKKKAAPVVNYLKKKAAPVVNYLKKKAAPVVNYLKKKVTSVAHYLKKKATSVAHWAKSTGKSALNYVKRKSTAFVHSLKRKVEAAEEKAQKAREWTKRKIAQAKQKAKEKARKVTEKARKVTAFVAKHTVVKPLVDAAKPILHTLKTVVSTTAALPAKTTAVVRDTVQDGVKNATELYHRAVEQAGPVVTEVSAAAGNWLGEGATDLGYLVRAARNGTTTLQAFGIAKADGADCDWTAGLTLECTGANIAPKGGVTIGNVFLTTYDKDEVGPEVLEHEHQHSNQYATLGTPRFLAEYLGASLLSYGSYAVLGKRTDSDGNECTDPWACYNAFEIDADLHKGGYYQPPK